MLVDKLQWSESETAEFLELVATILTEKVTETGELNIEDFGVFKTHKRLEYISLSRERGERYLMPPEIELIFEDHTHPSAANNFSDDLSDKPVGSYEIDFTPDELLVKKINSPFQHFEPTLINEGVELVGLRVVVDDETVPSSTLSQPILPKAESDPESPSELPLEPFIEPSSGIPPESPFESDSESPFESPAGRAQLGLIEKTGRRKNNRYILLPLLGGLTIALAALFFFDSEK